MYEFINKASTAGLNWLAVEAIQKNLRFKGVLRNEEVVTGNPNQISYQDTFTLIENIDIAEKSEITINNQAYHVIRKVKSPYGMDKLLINKK